MADDDVTATCKFLQKQYGIKPMQSWGNLKDLDLRAFWDKHGCNAHVTPPEEPQTVRLPVHAYWGNWNDGVRAPQLFQNTPRTAFINAFWDVTADCQINGRNSAQEILLRSLKCTVLAGVGGWGSTTPFGYLVRDKRAQLVEVLGAAVVAAGWQGLAVDWEYPGGQDDWNNLTAFCQSYKQRWPQHTLAVAAQAELSADCDWLALGKAVDWVHVMTYGELRNLPILPVGIKELESLEFMAPCTLCGGLGHRNGKSKDCPANQINRKRMSWRSSMLDGCIVTPAVIAGFADGDGSISRVGKTKKAVLVDFTQCHEFGRDALELISEFISGGKVYTRGERHNLRWSGKDSQMIRIIRNYGIIKASGYSDNKYACESRPYERLCDAYIGGFFAADGSCWTNHDSIQLSFRQKDIGFLNELRIYFGMGHIGSDISIGYWQLSGCHALAVAKRIASYALHKKVDLERCISHFESKH